MGPLQPITGLVPDMTTHLSPVVMEDGARAPPSGHQMNSRIYGYIMAVIHNATVPLELSLTQSTNVVFFGYRH